MKYDQATILKTIKYLAIALSALMIAGVAALMFISRDKNEDITGIVAPAALITMISTVLAIIASVLQKRAVEKNNYL